MLGTLILGFIAGAVAPHAEPKVKPSIESFLLNDQPANPVELRVFTFSLCLLGAAILAMAFSEPHAVPLALGAAIGVFGPKLKAKWNTSKNPDYDS